MDNFIDVTVEHDKGSTETIVQPDFDMFEVEKKLIYAIQNELGQVTSLVSSTFITEEQKEVAKVIDSGDGDAFVHVGEYLNSVVGEQLIDERGILNFKLETEVVEGEEVNKMVARTKVEKDEEFKKKPKPPKVPSVAEINETVQSLNETIEIISEAISEVDGTVQDASETAAIAAEAVTEVDEKLAFATETAEIAAEAVTEVDNKVSEQNIDVTVALEAIMEIDGKVQMILEHLNLTAGK